MKPVPDPLLRARAGVMPKHARRGKGAQDRDQVRTGTISQTLYSAVIFIPIPLPEKVIRTSYCPHLFYKLVLYNYLGHRHGYECHSPYTLSSRVRGQRPHRGHTDRTPGSIGPLPFSATPLILVKEASRST